jgi:hypothetical protein
VPNPPHRASTSPQIRLRSSTNIRKDRPSGQRRVIRMSGIPLRRLSGPPRFQGSFWTNRLHDAKLDEGEKKKRKRNNSYRKEIAWKAFGYADITSTSCVTTILPLQSCSRWGSSKGRSARPSAVSWVMQHRVRPHSRA